MGGYLKTGGVPLAWEGFGDPLHPALVLVMGATASMLWWPEALCRGFAARGYHVIRYDARGTGRSPRCGGDYAVENLCSDLLALIEEVAGGRAHVMGMSLGAYVAQMAAVSRPEAVAALVLFAAEPLGWQGDDLPGMSDALMAHFGGLGEVDWQNPAAAEAFLLGVARLCAGQGAAFDPGPVLARIDAERARAADLEAAFAHAALTLRADWGGRLAELDLPVLVLHGEDDPVLPQQNGAALAGSIAGARLVTFAGVGHELPDRLLPEMVQVVAGFLAGVPTFPATGRGD